MKTKGIREPIDLETWSYHKYNLPDKYYKIVQYIYKKFLNESWDDCYSELKKKIPQKYHQLLKKYLPEFPDKSGEYDLVSYIPDETTGKYKQVRYNVDNVHEYIGMLSPCYYVKDGILYQTKKKPSKRIKTFKQIKKKEPVVEKVYKFKYDFEAALIQDKTDWNLENRFDWDKVDITPFKKKLTDFIGEDGFVSDFKSDVVDIKTFINFCKKHGFSYKIMITNIIKNPYYGKKTWWECKKPTKLETIKYCSNDT